ncbi:MAG: CoA pyrophosphatase [Dehalococcoidia bacterium]|nr:CoA pyrophosphatase [Dehalococcoidia bacterium]
MKEEIRRALAAREKRTISTEGLTRSAVLIPLFEKEGRCHILFTKRTDHLHHHKGQISFPGGGRHEEDRSMLETALRESREEIGLKESDVEILGEMDDAATLTSFYHIVPFVGLIPYPYDFKPDKFEVREVFSLSLDDLMNKAVRKSENYTFGDLKVEMHSYELDGRFIWGATAWMLGQLIEIIGPLSGVRGGC